jgi:type I restriction enzyme S subunit
MVPDGWKVCQVGEIARVIRGASPRPKGDHRYYGGKVPRLMVSDVTRDGKYVTPKTDFLTEEGAKLSRPMPAGSLTVVCSGTVGVPSFLAVDACIHDGFLALDNISDTCDKEYLYYTFSRLQQDFDSAATHGGVFTNLTTEILRTFKIPLPTVPEQKKIAAILSSVDEAIAFTQAVIDQTRKVKQGLLQQLLTRGIGHTKFKESAIGKIPESWEIVPLAQLCEKIVNGYVGATRDIYHEEGTPYILCQNVRANRFVPKIFKWVSKEFHENNSRSALKEGDVITVQTGAGNGDTCVVPPQFDGANCHALIISRAKPNLLNSYYLSEYLNSPEGRARIDVISTGMAYPHLNTTELRKLLIPLPTIQEQDGIVQYLRSFESTIFENEFYLNSLENLKRGLMQDLLTGKVRVGCTP